MSCAWPDPDVGHRHTAEFCENGAKAVAEEATKARATPEFFAAHSIAELDAQSEHWLGQQGRITHPMVKQPGGTHYEPIGWEEAYALIGGRLNALASPNEAIFYTSGPDLERGRVRLPAVRPGVRHQQPARLLEHVPRVDQRGAGRDHRHRQGQRDAGRRARGQAAGRWPARTRAPTIPRMLSALETAKRRGAKILAINPLREAGLVNFRNPQHPRGLVGRGTDLADLHLPIKINGDLALFQAFGALLVEWGALDTDFVDAATPGVRRLAGPRHRPGLGPGDRDHRADPGADRRGGRAAARLRPHRVLLGDGADPAPQRGGHDLRDRQPGAGPGQYRQAGRRAAAGARPLQRAGRPDHGHLGAAAADLPGPAAGASSASIRRASTGYDTVDAIRALRDGMCRCSSGWAATSSRRRPTPR